MDLFDDEEPEAAKPEESSDEDDDSDEDDSDEDESSEEEDAPKATGKFGGRGRGRGAPVGRGGIGAKPADDRPAWARKKDEEEEGASASPFGAVLKKSPAPAGDSDNVPQWKKDMEAKKAAAEAAAGGGGSGGATTDAASGGDNVPQWKKDMEARKAAAAAGGAAPAAGGGENVPQWKKDMEARKAAAAAAGGAAPATGAGENVPQWKKDMEAKKAAAGGAAGASPAQDDAPAWKKNLESKDGGSAGGAPTPAPTPAPAKITNVGVFRQGVAKELEKMIDRHKYQVEDVLEAQKEIIAFQESLKEECDRIEKLEANIEKSYLDQTKIMEVILTIEDFIRKTTQQGGSASKMNKLNKHLATLREQYLNTNLELASAKQRLAEARTYVSKAEDSIYALDPARKLGPEGISDLSGTIEGLCDAISALQVEDNQRKRQEKEEDEKIIQELLEKKQKEETERKNRERKAKYDKPRKRGGGGGGGREDEF